MIWNAKSMNKYFVPSSCILPKVEDLLDTFGGDCRLYNSCDLAQMYWQIGVDEDYSSYFAAATPFGIYKPKAVVQGEHSAPPAAQYLSQKLISGLTSGASLIDDIGWGGTNPHDCLDGFESLLAHLRAVSGEQAVTIRCDKLSIAAQELTFLGQHVAQGKRIANVDKIRKAVERRPTDIQDLSSFTSFASYFRAYMPLAY